MILGPFLFNIFLTDLSFIKTILDIGSYADVNTLYVSAENIVEVLDSLEQAANTLFKSFKSNLFKGNTDNFHLQ